MINPDQSKLIEGRNYYFYRLDFCYGYHFNREPNIYPITKVTAHLDGGYWNFNDPDTGRIITSFRYYYNGKLAEEYEEAVQDWNNIVDSYYNKFKSYVAKSEKNILSRKLPNTLPE